MAQSLTKADVERLLTDPSPEARIGMIGKLAADFDSAALNDSERNIAEAIFRALAQDAAVRVRQALSDHLKESHGVPRDVALKLARDVDAVALPILTHSVVLTDEDLVQIVSENDASGGSAKHQAIARRETVSPVVADALIEKAGAPAIAVLVGNEGAKLGPRALEKIVERHGEDAAIQNPLANRKNLPLVVVEKLIVVASDSLREQLMAQHDLPPEVAADLIRRVQERATAALIAPSPAEESYKLARHMKQAGRLTPSLLLRTLCLGDLAFLEAGMAELAEIPITNAQLLIDDPGGLGFKRLYERTKLPAALLSAFRIALDAVRETPFDGGENDRERHRLRILERVLTQFEDVGAEDLDFLLDKLQSTGRTAAA